MTFIIIGLLAATAAIVVGVYEQYQRSKRSPLKVRCPTHGESTVVIFSDEDEELGRYCFRCYHNLFRNALKNHKDK